MSYADPRRHMLEGVENNLLVYGRSQHVFEVKLETAPVRSTTDGRITWAEEVSIEIHEDKCR